jgi:hypothetical protein
MPSRTPILYIAGSGRSGSTLVNVLLGQLPGFAAVGEARDVFDLGLTQRGPCGCGAAVPDCDFWTRVLARTFGGGAVDPLRWAGDKERFLRTKRIAQHLLLGRFDRAGERGEYAAYTAMLKRLYDAIREESRAEVIVDASKWPTYARVLGDLEGYDLHVVHLVRDPRACAYSWQNRKAVEPGRTLETQGAFYTTSFWVTWNTIIPKWFDKPGRYLQLRYEDFVAEPRESIRRIAAFLGRPDARLPFTDARSADLGITHSIAGNDGRFSRGPMEISPRDRWREALAPRSRRIVELMTFPLLARYGYGRG